MANTFTKIASYTVASGGVSSFTFSSIPQTYTDLCLKISDRGSRSAAFYSNAGIKINNDANIYDWKFNRDYVGTVGAFSATNDADLEWYSVGASSTANSFCNTEIYIANYTSSANKSIYQENIVDQNSTDCFVVFGGWLYKSTNPVTSIVVWGSPNSYTLQANSVYTLYGIKNS